MRSHALRAILLGLVPSVLTSQVAPLELPRLTSPVVVDGVLDDAAWRAVAPLPLTMFTPVFRGTPTQRTEIRVAYDDEFLYVAGWLYDTEPPGIRVNSLYRDRWNGDDAFAVNIDAFNDNLNSKWFGTTPAGMRYDFLVTEDGAAENLSWDAFWMSRTTMTDEGWFVEVQIPFSTLGFRTGPDGASTMGLMVSRLISRSGERVTFPELDPQFDVRRPSLARDVVLRGVRSRAPAYITPYVLGGESRRASAVEPAGYREERSTATELGLDVRYPLSGSLTLDLTANTDFAQVEADDQQVNLDRFPLFFPERRRFFQEGSGLFDFATGDNVRLFNSRRIGLTPDGAPVPVVGGARVVGRVGTWDVGGLAMRTREWDQAPAENFGVMRVRRSVLNRWSTVGAMVTGFADGSRSSVAGGADALLRLVGNDYLSVKLASTTGDGSTSGDMDLASRSMANVKFERRQGRGLAFTTELTRVGADFRPEIGFLPRQDFSSVTAFANYFIFTDGHPFFRRVFPGMLIARTFRNSDRVLESGATSYWFEFESKPGGGGWIEHKRFQEDVVAPFSIGPAITIPAGSHSFESVNAFYRMPSGSRLRANVDVRVGTYFDGRRTQVLLQPTWNASRHLDIGLDYQLSALRFPLRGQSDDISVARLRVGTALDVKLSGNAFVQYNSASDALDFNVRLRYAVSEGTDLWLVYNAGLDTDRASDGLGGLTPSQLSRSLWLKYTHTFVR